MLKQITAGCLFTIMKGLKVNNVIIRKQYEDYENYQEFKKNSKTKKE